MATAKKATADKAPAKHTSIGLKQDRAKVAGKQAHEVGYEARKTGAKPAEVKAAVKAVGNSRKAVEKSLGK